MFLIITAEERKKRNGDEKYQYVINRNEEFLHHVTDVVT